MSYSGYKSSPRSRGFRGSSSYRGSSRGGGDGNWRGGSGRGYSGSSRGGRGSRFSSGGGKWERESSGSYDTRPRYSSGGERYASHREDGSYRSYRGDDTISSYTSREHSHRASSPERKRIRTDYSPASSMHRSHDYGDDSYSSRNYSGYENKRMSGGSYGGGEDRRTSLFREERERIRSDDYEFRKPLGIGGPRHSTPRGSSYRGRTFSRGRSSSSFRRPTSYRGGSGSGYLRKRLTESYGVRKRIATGKSQEYLRRLKLYRLQRLKRLRDRADKEDDDMSDDDEDVEEEEIEEEIETEITDEENEDVEMKEEDEKEDKKDDNEEDVEEEKKDEEKKTKKIKKVVKVVKKVVKKKVIKKENEKEKDENDDSKEIHVTVKQDSEGRDVDGPVRKNYLGQPFMTLVCPHCNTSAETFKEYLSHLYTSKHQTAMMNAAVKVRKALARLRLDQRTEQRDIDEECKLKNMNMRTFYCLACKLNYRSLKSEHLRSDKHVQMRNFLNPICKICRISCKTPMMYENHICSLEHLKRKHYFDKKNAERQEGNEIDMDKYMVLDQVGSGEEESESDETSEKDENEKEEKEEGKADEDGENVEKKPKKKKKKEIVNLGSEYCKKIEIYFCDLCKTFLPRIEDQEQALAVHCRGQRHLHWYVKKKDHEALRKRAERIHKMREEQKKAEIKEEEKEDEPMDEDDAETETKSESKKGKSAKKPVDEEEGEVKGMDNKTWSELKNDLTELLSEVDMVNKENLGESDDEEDSRAAGRRYDRFKHSEKNKEGDEEKEKSEEKSASAEAVNGEKDDA